MFEYHAFISYSHKDKTYASIIQKSIERLGLPFYKNWQSDVSLFRDERKIPLSGSLSEEIIKGLRGSKYLIVIASRNSAGSTWVKEEILTWHERNYDEEGYITNFNFILIDDIVEWDYLKKDFDRLKTTALPTFDTKLFRDLPIWANLQYYCKDGSIQTENANYEWEIAKIKALLLDKKPDEIIDDVSKGKRSFRVILFSIIGVLLSLTLFAFLERSRAIKQRDIALSRELILNAEKNIKSNPDLSLILAVDAAKKQLKDEGRLSPDMRSSLLRIVKTNSRTVPFKNSSNIGEGGIESFAISPDQSQIAIGSQGDTIWVMDSRKYSVCFTLYEKWPACIKWSSDGKYIASSGQEDKSIKIWDAKNGSLVKQYTFENSGGVESVDWRLNTHQVAFAIAKGDSSLVKVLDADRDTVLFEVPGIRAAWSNDGEKIATGGCNDESWSIRIYSSDGSLLGKQPGHHRYVHNISWSPDNAYVATSSVDNQVIIWDAVTCSRAFTITQEFSLCSAWSSDLRYLAVGGGEESVKIYDVKARYKLVDSIDYSTTITGDKIEETAIRGYVLNLNWSSDGKYLLLSDREGTITYYDGRLFNPQSDAEIVEIASSMKKRDLSAQEVARYLSLD